MLVGVFDRGVQPGLQSQALQDRSIHPEIRRESGKAHAYGYNGWMVYSQVSFSEEQADRLRAEAAARGVSQAELLRQALDAYLDHRSLSACVHRARLPVGAFRSGCGSLAMDHDDALGEAFSA